MVYHLALGPQVVYTSGLYLAVREPEGKNKCRKQLSLLNGLRPDSRSVANLRRVRFALYLNHGDITLVHLALVTLIPSPLAQPQPGREARLHWVSPRLQR